MISHRTGPLAAVAVLVVGCAGAWPFGERPESIEAVDAGASGAVEEADSQASGPVEEVVAPAGDPAALSGTRWLVLSYPDAEGRSTTPLPGTSLTVGFADPQRLAGSAGCNRYSAGYERDGEQISVGPALSTRMMCGEPEGVMLQETSFLAALQQVSRIDHRAEQLSLRSDSADVAIELVSAVTGSFGYRILKAIPPNTRLRIVLEEVGEAGAEDRRIAEHSFIADGKQLAFEFRVVFDPAVIEPDRSYQLRALMHDAQDTLILATLEPTPVITGDHPIFGVELMLDAVERAGG